MEVKPSRKALRFYFAFLNEIRESLFPEYDSEEFHEVAKDINPNFPIDENGDKKSLSKLTVNEFEEHIRFLKTLAIKRGVVLSSFDSTDIKIAENTRYRAGVDTIVKEGDGRVLCKVVCSNCGISTLRSLTEERFNELEDIQNNKRDERFEPLSESFLCMWCFSSKLDNMQNGGKDK